MTAQPPHVVISFDMETDLGNWWTTCEGVSQGTPAILEISPLRAASAAFLFTASAQACPDAVKIILGAGCEVGCRGLNHAFLGEANSETPVSSRSSLKRSTISSNWQQMGSLRLRAFAPLVPPIDNRIRSHC